MREFDGGIDSFECVRCLKENKDVVTRFRLLPADARKVLHWVYFQLNPAYDLEDYREVDWMQIIVYTRCNYCNGFNDLCNYERLGDFTNKTGGENP